MRKSALLALVAAAFAATTSVASCVGDDSGAADSGTDSTIPAGSLDGPCFSNGTCNAGLSCVLQGGTGVCLPGDAGAEAATDAQAVDATTETTYSTLDDSTKWAAFDTAGVDVDVSGFAGAAFDGRYVYFVPKSQPIASGLAVRYDTTASFGAQTSWEVFDTSSLDAGAAGFAGAAFDGRYVYFSPNQNAGGPDGVVTRYDTAADAGLDAAAAWGTFDTTSLAAGAKGFAGAAFDGQYVYFVPDFDSAVDALVVRFNTKGAGFFSASSWQTFDATTVNANAGGFQGAVFDGRYVVFVPNNDGVAVRYDTTQAFQTASSWQAFDARANVNNNAQGYVGGAFDGRYVYFAPFASYGGTNALVTRFDTAVDAGFDAGSSWGVFDTTGIVSTATGYYGAAFDGRYVYCVPHGYVGGSPLGVLARYDTDSDASADASFGAAASWDVFDLTTLDGGSTAQGFWGAAFDGRYLYLVPNVGTVVWRFDAKTPASLPAGPAHGSFF